MPRGKAGGIEHALATVHGSASDLAPVDEPEAVDELRLGLGALVAGDPAARLDAWEQLVQRFSEGHVSYATAVPLLVELAEALGEPARCSTLALLVALGHGALEGGTSPAELDAAFVSVASRLDRLSGLFGLSPRLAKRAARRARGKRYELDEVAADLETVESRLTKLAAEHGRRADAASRTPEALAAAARAAVIHDDRTAANAITLAYQCLNRGLPEEVLSVCGKLGEWWVRAEPARIRALILLGRVEEAREATIELTRAWLTPATSARSANQVLLKDEMRELLRDARKAIAGQDVVDLARAVERAEIEIFVGMDTDSF